MLADVTPTRTQLQEVLIRAAGWALAWGASWAILGIVGQAIIFGSAITGGPASWLAPIMVMGIGGVAGGFVAGILTMLAVRDDAPKVGWRLMAASVWIWGVIAAIVVPIVFVMAVAWFFSDVASGSLDRSGSGNGLGVIVGELLIGAVAGLIAVTQIRRAGILTTPGTIVGIVISWAIGSVVGWSLTLVLWATSYR